ncbi:MAG TPA: NAD(P)-binding domain-containing protein [Candidatus Dormibacteraeota bacterium]|nr:NAD(P)-binding domain-containing protein [Candidatus Dormibacteraeota bacterium]
MAELTERPFPPGRYPLVLVGSGPGALQLTYSLRRLGVEHAVISADPEPGGMFRRWPIFQRMLSWTKPYADQRRGTPEYERYDWNSLLGEDDETRAIMPGVMDGTSYFPSRPEMQLGLRTFAEKAHLSIRHGCAWESTRREADDFVLTTSDGEYRAKVAVFAVGIAEPWKPHILDVEGVQQYGDLRPAETYADRRIFIVGKQNSGFEIASGLLPWARQIVLASPSATRLSVDTRSLVGVRARYVQPYEDWALAGGVVVLDASIERVERTSDGYVVHTRRPSDGMELPFEADDLIAATGFVCPLRDLPQLGVETFGQSRIPLQTPFWESAKVPGIYFAGTIMQGSQGMRKYGIPSNSGAVQGHRYNARVLAAHIAEKHFNRVADHRRLEGDEVVPFLLDQASRGPELWHQRSYLARVVHFDAESGITDRGIQPLMDFVDNGTSDGVAITLEANGKDDPYPVAYVRSGGAMKDHPMPPDPLLRYDRPDYQRELSSALKSFLVPTMTGSAQ